MMDAAAVVVVAFDGAAVAVEDGVLAVAVVPLDAHWSKVAGDRKPRGEKQVVVPSGASRTSENREAEHENFRDGLSGSFCFLCSPLNEYRSRGASGRPQKRPR